MGENYLFPIIRIITEETLQRGYHPISQALESGVAPSKCSMGGVCDPCVLRGDMQSWPGLNLACSPAAGLPTPAGGAARSTPHSCLWAKPRPLRQLHLKWPACSEWEIK